MLVADVAGIIIGVAGGVKPNIEESRVVGLIDPALQLADATLRVQCKCRDHKDQSSDEFYSVPRLSFKTEAYEGIEEDCNRCEQDGPDTMASPEAVPDGIDC